MPCCCEAGLLEEVAFGLWPPLSVPGLELELELELELGPELLLAQLPALLALSPLAFAPVVSALLVLLPALAAGCVALAVRGAIVGTATAASAINASGAVSVFRRRPHPRLRIGALMRLRIIPVPPSSSRGLVVWCCMPQTRSVVSAMALSKRAAWGFVSVG